MKNILTRDQLFESNEGSDLDDHIKSGKNLIVLVKPGEGASTVRFAGKSWSVETDAHLNGKDGYQQVQHLHISRDGYNPGVHNMKEENMVRVKKDGKWTNEYESDDVHMAIEMFNDIAQKYGTAKKVVDNRPGAKKEQARIKKSGYRV